MTESKTRPPLGLPFEQAAPPPRTPMPLTPLPGVRIGQRPTPEVGIQLPHDSAEARRIDHRHRLQNELKVISCICGVAARTVRPRHVKPTTRLTQERLIPLQGEGRIPQPRLPELQLGSRRPRPMRTTWHPTRLPATELDPLISAHCAGRPTRHRPFGSKSPSHTATTEPAGLAQDRQVQISTSDQKEAQAMTWVTQAVAEFWETVGVPADRPVKVLYCLGLRGEESAGRASQPVLQVNERRSSGNRRITRWLPILGFTVRDVREEIRAAGLRVHAAYSWGTRRHVDRTTGRLGVLLTDDHSSNRSDPHPWRIPVRRRAVVSSPVASARIDPAILSTPRRAGWRACEAR